MGDGQDAFVPDDVDSRLKEIKDFTSVLDTAIRRMTPPSWAMTQDTVGGELRDFAEGFPERKDATVTDGKEERAKARGALKEAVLALHAVGTAAAAGNFDAAGKALANFRTVLVQAVPLLKAAEPWSVYNPDVRAARIAQFRSLYQAAFDPASAPRRPDND
ncbi:MAG: hypothetical protein WDN69_18020 [Aliidongia sp.]